VPQQATAPLAATGQPPPPPPPPSQPAPAPDQNLVSAAPVDQDQEEDNGIGPVAWRTVAPVPPPSHRAEEEKKRRKRRPFAIFTGILGELLITAGCLLGLYVVWELVWTTVEANRQVRAEVKEIRSDPRWVTPEGGFAPEHTGAPAEKCVGPVPAFGEVWGQMLVPRWGADYDIPVVEGIDRVEILNRGVIGHYPDTQKPGEIGNFATSAHRTTYGAPYNRVEELQVDDLAILETPNCYLVYKMYGTEVVYPNEYRVVWPVPNEAGAVPTKRIMTFTTCHPPFSARQRFVVWFEMAYWTDKDEGKLEALGVGE